MRLSSQIDRLFVFHEGLLSVRARIFRDMGLYLSSPDSPVLLHRGGSEGS